MLSLLSSDAEPGGFEQLIDREPIDTLDGYLHRILSQNPGSNDGSKVFSTYLCEKSAHARFAKLGSQIPPDDGALTVGVREERTSGLERVEF